IASVEIDVHIGRRLVEHLLDVHRLLSIRMPVGRVHRAARSNRLARHHAASTRYARGRQLRGMRRSTGFGMVTRFWCCFSVPPAGETSTAALTDPAPAPLRPATVGPIEAALMNIAQKSTFVLNQRDLLGIEGLSREEILGLLDLAEHFVDLNRQIDKKQVSLRGRTLINLFFEVSTRTQASFELAGKRLGADVMNMSVGSSSMRKGETLIDTAITLNAMHPDIIVVRHHASGAVELLARKVDCSVINAG